MNHQPLEIQTLYAELVDQLTALEAQRSIGMAPGTFVTKTVKGQTYYYFQYSEAGGSTRQTYLGRRDPALDAIAERHRAGKLSMQPDLRSVNRLCTLLKAGGAQMIDSPSARVMRALADGAVFRLGGVLVGTQAFLVMANVLGVRWASSMRTQDIDIAAEPRVDVAVSGMDADVPSTLDSLEMGFLPVPGLDPASPATSFKVRGQGLRVDLLTPARRGTSGPIEIRRLHAAAQPLEWLDYLVEQSVRAAVIDGNGILVNIPDPARFALHKLVVAGLRPVSMSSKRVKDISQACQVLGVVTNEHAGDVEQAWEALTERGRRAQAAAHAGLALLAEADPTLADRVSELTA